MDEAEESWTSERLIAECSSLTMTMLRETSDTEIVVCSEEGKVFQLNLGDAITGVLEFNSSETSGFKVEEIQQIGLVKDKTLFLIANLRESMEFKQNTQQNRKKNPMISSELDQSDADSRTEDMLSLKRKKWQPGQAYTDSSSFAFPKFGATDDTFDD